MTTLEALLELQEVDGRIREFEKELKDLPQRKAKEEARLTGVKTDLDAAHKGHDYALKRVKDYEEDAAALKDKIRDLKQTQAGLQSNKEYQQYSVQIDLINHDLEATENNQLAAMDDLPSAEARITAAQEKFDAAKSGIDAYCAEIDARMREVEAELDAARKERAEKVAAVKDPQAMLYYERLRTKRWPVVVALTHESVCDGCHLVQPPSVAQNVDANMKAGEMGRPQRVVACNMCGRILFR